MQRWRSMLGLVAGALMLASSAAHSLLGWKAMRGGLEQARAPEDLIQSLGFGWLFGGVAMLGFGAIVVTLFAKRLKGVNVSLMPSIVIGATYVVFGSGAFLASGFDPFFFIFVVPGVLLSIASAARRGA